MSGDTPQTHVTHSTTLSSLSSSPVTVIIVTISVRRELPGELDLLEVSHVLPGEGEEPEDPAGHLGDGEGPRDVAGSLEQEGEGEETHVGQALDQDLALHGHGVHHPVPLQHPSLSPPLPLVLVPCKFNLSAIN